MTETTYTGQWIGGGFGAAVTPAVTTADTVFDTAGDSIIIGLDTPATGGDISFGFDKPLTDPSVRNTNAGFSMSPGAFVGGDFHVELATTKITHAIKLSDFMSDVERGLRSIIE